MNIKFTRSWYFGLLICLIPIFYAVIPLFQKQFIPTHDGEYHIIRFWQFFSMLHAGYIFPRWTPDLNSGYGIPLFNFFYPLPNYVGSILHIVGWSFVDSFKVALALGYMLAGVFCFFWLRKLFSQYAAVVGTIMFSFVPYWFVDIYVRGSIGEVWAITFLTMAFWLIESKKPRLFALSIALLILSHNISAMILLPVIFLYVLLRNKPYVLLIFSGILLSAYFWLPALVEKGYVVGLNSVDYRDHFPMLVQLIIPSWGTGFSGGGYTYDELSFQIGVIPLVLLFWSCLLVTRIKKKEIRILYVFFIALCAISVVFMLRISQPVWQYLSFLQLIQYPWRLLVILLPVVAFISSLIIYTVKRKWFVVMLAILAIVLTHSYVRPVQYSPRSDAYYLSKKEFTDGTSSLGNTFTTKWTEWKKQRVSDKIEILSGTGNIVLKQMRPLDYAFTANMLVGGTMRINTLYYPGWTVYIDGKSQSIDYTRDGTLQFDVGKGTHSIAVHFIETPVRQLADGISFACLFCLVGWAILDLSHAYRNRHIISYKRS